MRYNVFTIILLFIGFVVSCSFRGPERRNFNMGVMLWVPENYRDDMVKKEVDYVLNGSDVMTVQLPWSPYSRNLLKQAKWISSLAKDHNKKLIINLDWMERSRNSLLGEGWSFREPNVKTRFLADALEICKLYNPDYLNLGVEVNFYGLIDQKGFKDFVQTYNATKLRINQRYTKTKVSVTFQVELLLGRMRDWEKNASLEIIDAFGGNLDILALSTYPHEDENGKLDIQLLSSFLKSYDKNFGIFEVSVPTNSHNEIAQSNYLRELLIYLNSNKNCELIVWTAIIDTVPSGTINSSWSNYLGLINYDLSPKTSWDIWMKWYHIAYNAM
jgi:hypothetical protein